jgi:hypothetical protein
MSILSQLACAQNTNSEVPNQELARKLAEAQEAEGIRELAENLWNRDSAIANDCIKALYEIGYLNPALIAPYALDFLKLLRSTNNRLVWGGMIALATVAALRADDLFPHAADIQKTMDKGSVITVDAGVLALAGIAAAKPEYNRSIFPYLLNHLRTCRPKEVPQHAEKTLPAVNAANQAEFIAVIAARLDNATPSQLARLKRVIKQAQKAGN